MRLGFAVLLFFTIKWEAGNLGTVKPEDAVGLAKFVDLTFFAPSPASIPIISATLPETNAVDIGGIRVERRYTYRTGDVVAPG